MTALGIVVLALALIGALRVLKVTYILTRHALYRALLLVGMGALKCAERVKPATRDLNPAQSPSPIADSSTKRTTIRAVSQVGV